MNSSQSDTVTPEYSNQRLDRWLRATYGNLTQSLIERLCRKGLIRVNGSRAKPSTRLVTGQQVQITASISAVQSKRSRPAPLDVSDQRMAARLRASVIFEDEFLLALNKPPGLATQGGSGQRQHVDKYLEMVGTLPKGSRLRLVHRLDKETSGVLLLAKTIPVARSMTRLFQSHGLAKHYLAVTYGVPSPRHGEIDFAIAKDTQSFSRRMVSLSSRPDFQGHGTKTASTLYQVLLAFGQVLSLVALAPQTGRTHQLRTHLAAIGHPILGDQKYIPKTLDQPQLDHFIDLRDQSRLFLHARSLEFIHPETQKPLQLIADFPEHMLNLAEVLEWNLNDIPTTPVPDTDI